MLTFFGIFCIFLIVVGTAGSVVVFQQSDEQRPKRLLRLAEAIGMGFVEDGTPHLSRWHQRTPLFSAGHHGMIRNVIYGPYQNIEFCAFDYHFESHGTWLKQTVVTAELKGKPIPRFCLWPTASLREPAVLDRPEDTIELQIDGIKDQYQLYSTSEGTTRQLLSVQAVTYLCAHPDYQIESDGHHLAIYQLDRCCNPTQINQMMRDAYHILHALRLNDPLADFEPTGEETDLAQDMDTASSSVK